MIMYSMCCLILLSYQLSSFTTVSAKNTRQELRPPVKRGNNAFQACLNNFEIHTDKIIRTQDSRNMGAKYINEIDVSSREDCLRLCCETEYCDVFVFEEKVIVCRNFLLLRGITQHKSYFIILFFLEPRQLLSFRMWNS